MNSYRAREFIQELAREAERKKLLDLEAKHGRWTAHYQEGQHSVKAEVEYVIRRQATRFAYGAAFTHFKIKDSRARAKLRRELDDNLLMNKEYGPREAMDHWVKYVHPALRVMLEKEGIADKVFLQYVEKKFKEIMK